MNNDNIFKIWGICKNIFKNGTVKVDHLIIKKDTCCSWHNHEHKSNRFYIISGVCIIKSELGETILREGQSFDVHPNTKHQFIGIEDSVMIEIAYIEISDADINREKQGGKIVDGVHITQDELKNKGLLNL